MMQKIEKLCACCGKRPIKTSRSKYCEVCSQHQSTINHVQRRGKDITQLWFASGRVCEWCGKRPIQKGGTKYCKVCSQHYNAISIATKKGLNKSSYQFSEERICAWCGRRKIPKNNSKYCEVCSKYATQIKKAQKKGLTVADLDYEKTAICECCGKRPVVKRGAKYCTECGKHGSQIAKARRKGKDITQLAFTGKKLCEFCHKRPVVSGKHKYCEVCSPHADEIFRLKQQGKDLAQIDFTKQKMCEYCGKRPVAKRKQKYCEECSKYGRRIAYIKEHGITAKEDFTQPRVCKECGEPIGFRRSVYCEHCGPHANTIWNARTRGYTGDFWFNGKICACCGKHPVGKGRVIYCNSCYKKYSALELRYKRDMRLLEAGKKLSKCLICKKRERIPGESYCRTCKNAMQRESTKGTYNYQTITKTRICECCGNRPVGRYKSKYCDICGKYVSSVIAQARMRGEDLSQLWFTGNKLCERCGEKYISGTGSHEYCDECAVIVYNSKAERWGRVLDQAEKTKPKCKGCGQELAGGGRFGLYCQDCFNARRLEQLHQWMAKKPKLTEGTPVARKKPTLCYKCGINERTKGSCYCVACRAEEQYTLNYVKGKKSLLTPVADPDIYYTEKSVTVDCPLCEEEKCLPKLPMGGKCKTRILKASKKSCTWQAVLKRRGIKAPSLADLDPEIAMIKENCIRCKSKPKKPGWIYCEDCMEAVRKEREQEFKAGLAVL